MEGYTALLNKYGRGGDNGTPERAEAEAAVLHRREKLFECVKRVSGFNRLTELKCAKDERTSKLLYGIDPHSRYVNLPQGLPPPMHV